MVVEKGGAIQLRVRVRPWVPTHEQMYALDTVSEFRTGDSTRPRVGLRRQISTGQLERVEQWETAGRRCTVFMISSQSCASLALGMTIVNARRLYPPLTLGAPILSN